MNWPLPQPIPVIISGWFVFLLICLPCFVPAQTTTVLDSTHNERIVLAGKEYGARPLYQKFWGTHYRKEWTTPVRVPVIDVDTVDGGLIPIEPVSNPKNYVLTLNSKAGKKWILRLVNKHYGGDWAQMVKGTFIEHVAKDQISTAHPFAAATVPLMAAAAGVHHTNSRIVFVPYTESLGRYNKTFANKLCILEEYPGPDAAAILTTEEVLEQVFNSQEHAVDQRAFVKARLFDMFLGDWQSSENQWRWLKTANENGVVYQPIASDRDQIYSKFDGFFPYLFTTPEHLEYLETFRHHIRNVKKFNFSARYIDRQFTNELPRQTWMELANELQMSLTDKVIEKAVQQLPPEVFSISGIDIIAQLKSRRNHLLEYAEKHYKFLSEEVEIVGTEEDDVFEISRLGANKTQIHLYPLRKADSAAGKPFYSRTFYKTETNEIRLYGLEGNDSYRIKGERNSNLPVRIIGGPERDSLINTSGSGSIRYYDNSGNYVSGKIRLRLSDDSAVHLYNYKEYKDNSGHTIKLPFYSNVRGIYLQAGYTYTRQKWRKEPYSWKQSLRVIYSLTNKAFGGDYEGLFRQVLGKWNGALHARYDAILRHNFFGVGNEAPFARDISEHRLLTEEGFGSIGLNRTLGIRHALSISGFYHSIKVKNSKNDFISQLIPSGNGTSFEQNHFIGGEVNYLFQHVNDPVVPTKGLDLNVAVSHTASLQQDDRSFQRYTTTLRLYLPLVSKFSLAIKSGGATITGDPLFYQLNWIGGGQTLRGFRRQRFYGKTAFFTNSELRWITGTKNYFFNGQIGLIAFIDNGRIWHPGEASGFWHIGYGGGILLAPFDKFSAAVYYGLSTESKLFSFRLAGKLF